jgi:hypothetical protein
MLLNSRIDARRCGGDDGALNLRIDARRGGGDAGAKAAQAATPNNSNRTLSIASTAALGSARES